jgi:glucokinase
METPDDPDNTEHNVARRVELIGDFIAEAEHTTGAHVRRVGISSPGLADSANRSMYQLPGKMWGIEGLDWEKALGNRWTVRVLNDANAALLGEQWVGAAADMTDVILLTLGTGVGGALMLNNMLVQGYYGRAGHFGQLILDPRGPGDIFDMPGSLEYFFGNSYLPIRTGGKYTSVAALVEDYRRGDRTAARHWIDSIEALAIGLTSLLNAFDPQCVVLGGGIADAEEALFDPLAQMMDKYEWRPTGEPVPIIKARLGNLAGAMGAANFVVHRT